MVIVLMFERHTAESCPMGNEKAMKAQMAAAMKLPELLKKHGVKIIGSWAVHNEHLIFYVMEAPNFEAVEKLGMEPEIMAWRCFSTAELKTAITMEEVYQRFAAKMQSK